MGNALPCVKRTGDDCDQKVAKTFLFVFSKMPGDVNPSFPIARKLVRSGNKVYYLSPTYREAIEDTGAEFLDATKYYALYSEGRTPETFGAANQLKKELGLSAADGEYMVRVKITNVELEKKLDGVLSAISEVKADAIVYDPVLNKEAAVASQIAKVPSVALLTFNGHGAWADLVQAKMKNDLPQLSQPEERLKAFQEASLNEFNMAATKRLNEKYVSQGMKELTGEFTNGILDPIPDVCIVTTTESQKAEQTTDMVVNSKVTYVGALLDEPGSLRAGGPLTKDDWNKVEAAMNERSGDGKVIFVSMGTVTTADGPLGWQGSPNSSLTGELLCQSVWGAAIEALGGEKGSGNVVLLTLGKDAQGNPRPLGDITKEAPGNVTCLPSLPQVDILSKGVDLFVTHVGQNSFVESISLQTPMLAVPTVGDQIMNAEDVVKLGVGKKVSRPPKGSSSSDTDAAEYRKQVKEEILAMLSDTQPYKDAVVKASGRYRAGGVDEAVGILEDVAACKC